MALPKSLTCGLLTQAMFTGLLVFLVFSNDGNIPLDIQIVASAAVGAMSMAMGVLGHTVAEAIATRPVHSQNH